MEDKRKDLKQSKRRRLLDGIVGKLAGADPSFYYLSTIDIATKIEASIQARDGLHEEDYLLLKDLSRRDIQILLSIHE
ncbi:MAG: hypothetical protein AAF465_04905 [Pseudomonadota bacterium]